MYCCCLRWFVTTVVHEHPGLNRHGTVNRFLLRARQTLRMRLLVLFFVLSFFVSAPPAKDEFVDFTDSRGLFSCRLPATFLQAERKKDSKGTVFVSGDYRKAEVISVQVVATADLLADAGKNPSLYPNDRFFLCVFVVQRRCFDALFAAVNWKLALQVFSTFLDAYAVRCSHEEVLPSSTTTTRTSVGDL